MRFHCQFSILLVLLALVCPSQAQLEPEAWTILKEGLSANPPDLPPVLNVLRKYQKPIDLQHLADAWLRKLTAAEGKVAEKRMKLESMLDGFDGSFGGGENGVQQARTFIRIRDELLKRPIAEPDIEKSIAAFVDRLGKAKDADRKLLKDFGKLARSRVNQVVK
jgi:hypothetical protein